MGPIPFHVHLRLGMGMHLCACVMPVVNIICVCTQQMYVTTHTKLVTELVVATPYHITDVFWITLTIQCDNHYHIL